jgi:hypothetical protein
MPRSYSAQTALVGRCARPRSGGRRPGRERGDRAELHGHAGRHHQPASAWRSAWCQALGLEPPTPAGRRAGSKPPRDRAIVGAWLAAMRCAASLDVRPARESHVIHIVYKAAAAAGRRPIPANAFAQAYVETVLALRTEPARVYSPSGSTSRCAARARGWRRRRPGCRPLRSVWAGVDRRAASTTRAHDLAELSSQLTAVQGQNTDALSKRCGARRDGGRGHAKPLVGAQCAPMRPIAWRRVCARRWA